MNLLSRRTALGALAGFVLRSETAEQCWTRTRPLGRDVYSRGVGAPLVVLHEIGGLSPATLSGGLPVETIYPGSKVRAVVLSQPALPFGAGNQQSIGVSESVLQAARASRTPLLGLRFREDTLCTSQRFDFLDSRFPGQFERLDIEGPPCFHQTWTHRLHAVLTGPFPEQRVFARKRVIAFLEEQLVGSGRKSNT